MVVCLDLPSETRTLKLRFKVNEGANGLCDFDGVMVGLRMRNFVMISYGAENA